MSNALLQLGEHGQSIWHDHIGRRMVRSGGRGELVQHSAARDRATEALGRDGGVRRLP